MKMGDREERSSFGSERSGDHTTTTLSASTTQQINESSTLLSPLGGPQLRKIKKKRSSSASPISASSINYRGVNIYQAAAQGNLPVCVLLWGMASAKRVNLMTPDADGNNPLHMAALADTAEVVGFLIQQARGYLADDVRLVDSRNHAGETPLLRTMSSGNLAVAKALLDEGSDPLVTDSQGNSIFTLLAKSGHIWCLNSMYHTICTMHGTQVALELMCTLDNEAHSALDWAADLGDVNIIEFFIRKGLNPYRVDAMNRTALYWAVKSNRIEAARFLMMCGCDPLQRDYKDQSPVVIALRNGFIELSYMLHAGAKQYHRSLPEESQMTIHCNDPSLTPKLFTEYSSVKKSHAIYAHNQSNKFLILGYGAFVFLVWLLTVFIPFYAWIVFVGLLMWMYRQNISSEADLTYICRFKLVRQYLVGLVNAPEKGLGLWMGTLAIYGLYLWSVFCTKGYSDAYDAISTFAHWTVSNPLQIKALDGYELCKWFYFMHVGLVAAAVLSWLKLVFFDTDPGILNTRESDFEEVLAQSLHYNGPPPSASYCRTTFVKKPLRSKYCRKIGCVVARMDHYCIWLNMTIGFKNHRSFYFFLVTHFLAIITAAFMTIRSISLEVASSNACEVFRGILSRDNFLVTALAFFMVLASLGLGALLYVQTYNILTNMTVNERLNRARYSYLIDSRGNPRNRFDRGMWTNFLEFLRVPGYCIDYTSIFELPPELTQENMRLNEGRHTGQRGRLFFVNNSGLHALFGTQSVSGSGPPSLDIEMATRNRGESTDSGDVSNSESALV